MDNPITTALPGAPSELESFARDLHEGLGRPGQKELPSKYLYDEVGSALFEVICVLPEYGLTRADTRLLLRHHASLIDRLPRSLIVAELGSGSSKKTRLILEPLCRRQATHFYPIDISAAALSQCARELGDVPGLSVLGLHSEYLAGLHEVVHKREPGTALLVLFLGSTIGNFDRRSGEQFLRDVRDVLSPGDLMLLSSDLVKTEAALISAYDDAAGVTAAFNKNVLSRINRELGGDFNLPQFRHQARWNAAERRIEMHLQADFDMTVTVEKAELAVRFAQGETIKTEDSYKYEPQEIIDMARRSGFACEAQFRDAEWPFAQSLLIAS